MQRTNAYIDAATHERLREVARERAVPLVTLLSQILDEWFQKQPEARDIEKRLASRAALRR